MQTTAKNTLRISRLICLFILAAMLLSILPLPAARAQDETLWLKTQYHSPGASGTRSWEFPYRDDLFTGESSEYNHTLAQASLGMALSAFRSRYLAYNEQDVTVRAYLENAGFTASVSQDYDKVPTIDTISTLIAKKEMDGFTVVAVAICGGGYTNEWTSNFTIGDEERHVGFNAASQKVQARIRSYLTQQRIDGPVKLWISGYSRAAAVTNLTAADMTDSGLFQDVFAYAFATPRTTKKPGNYPNIFNILGKFDPVTLVPVPEWGYKRNGVELYTPAQETDSDYVTKKAAADEISQRLSGKAFFNNTEMNATLHTILDYLLAILPTSAVYAEHMQDIMISVWKNRSLGNLSSVIIKMMEDEELLNQKTKYEMERLLDYLSLVTYTTAAGQVTGRGSRWNSQTSMTDNLAHEHSPDVYVCWMFSSDDPGQIFSSADTYVAITWDGSAIVSVFDTSGQFVFSIDGQGRMSYSTDVPAWAALTQPLDQRPLISCVYKNGNTVITLPRDGNYLLYLEGTQKETMYYIGAEYRIDAIKPTINDINYVDVEKDEPYIIWSMDDETAEDDPHLTGSISLSVNPWDDENPYSPSVMTLLQNRNVFHLTFGQMATIAGGLLVLLLVLMVCLTVHLIHRHRRKRLAKARAALEKAAAARESDEHAAAEQESREREITTRS